MNQPLLYALQVYEPELPSALDLARLHEELCGGVPYSGVDALVVYRRDCPRSIELETILERVFPMVQVHVTKRRETGFPAGPNGVWCDLMQHLAFLVKIGRLKSQCVLTTEVDAIPLSKDWPQRLLTAWTRANKSIVGCWHPTGEHKVGHINGNALFDPALASKTPRLIGCPEWAAWDTYFARLFSGIGWADIPEIRNLYRATNLSANDLEKLVKDGCVWLHGVKDDSAKKWVRATHRFYIEKRNFSS